MSIISLLNYTSIYIHLHKFPYKHMLITQWHICAYSVWRYTLMHAKGLAKKPFIFSAVFPTLVLALGLYACLGVTKKKEETGTNKTEDLYSLTFWKEIHLPGTLSYSVHRQKFSWPLHGVSRSNTLLCHPHVRPNVVHCMPSFLNSAFITSPLLPRPCTLPATSNQLRESQWIKQQPTCINW